MGGSAASMPPKAPAPKLAASATSIRISTNVQPAAAAAKTPPPPAAPAKTVKPAPAPVQAAQPATPTPIQTASGHEITAYRLRPGDPVVIFLRGILPKDDQLQDIVDDGGYLNMPYIGAVLAAGKTTSQLENEIQKLYLEKQIYKSITVNVVLPSQNFFVRGEVKIPGRFPMVSGMTVMQAISAAGGYTDYADPKGANVIRGDKMIRVNARELERHPERDIPIEPGDVVVVPRSLF
jgi:polysaccharide export outer membrane protein